LEVGKGRLWLENYISGVRKILKCGIWEIYYWGWQNIVVGLAKYSSGVGKVQFGKYIIGGGKI